MLADEVDYVIGVDTHRDEHAVAAIDRVGSVIIETVTATNEHAFVRLLEPEFDSSWMSARRYPASHAGLRRLRGGRVVPTWPWPARSRGSGAVR